MKAIYFSLALLVLAVLFVASGGSSVDANGTTFGGVFVAGNGDAAPSVAAEEATFNNSVDNLAQALDNANWNPANQEKLKQKTKAEIEAAINKFKPGGAKELKSGDEFVFFYAGHGGDGFFPDNTEAGEGNGSDNHIRVKTGVRITDDELATMLSGFNKSVTINVILSSCKSNTFMDGANDLPSITQKDGANNVAGGDHLALIAAGDTTDFVDNDPVGMEFVKKLIDGLKPTAGGNLKADNSATNGTVTTKELSDHAAGLFSGNTNNKAACDGGTCPIQGCNGLPVLYDLDLTIVNKLAEPGTSVGGAVDLLIGEGSESALGDSSLQLWLAVFVGSAGVITVGWILRSRRWRGGS